MKPLQRLLMAAAATLMTATTTTFAVELSNEEIDNLVKRTYQYVAMYNVINATRPWIS